MSCKVNKNLQEHILEGKPYLGNDSQDNSILGMSKFSNITNSTFGSNNKHNRTYSQFDPNFLKFKT